MKYFKLLKAVSLISFITVILPFTDTFAAIAGTPKYTYQLKSFITAVLFMAVVVCIHKGINKLLGYYNYVLKASVGAVIFILTVIPYMVFVPDWTGLVNIFGNILTIFFLMLSAVLGSIFFDFDYSYILTIKHVKRIFIIEIAEIVFFLVLNLFFAMQEQTTFSYDYTLTFYGMLFMSSVFFITANQSGIDYLMVRGKHDLKYLPPKVRRYSFKLALVIEAILFLGLLLKNVFGMIFGALYELIMKLLRDFFSNVGPSDELIVPLPESSSQMSQEIAQSDGTNIIMLILSYVLMAACLAVVLYLAKGLIVSLFRYLVNLYYRLVDEFKEKRNGILKKTENKYYVDTDEFIKPKSVSFKKEKRLTVRRWKREYRMYMKAEKGVQKIREGYILVLKWFKLRGVPIKQSNTANEIFAQNEKKYNFKNFLNATESYNEAEYAQADYSEESQSAMDNMLNELNLRLPKR